MTYRNAFAILGTLTLVGMLNGCVTTKTIEASERDTTGTYDGVWIGAVDGPFASKVLLPGNWAMNCEWEPFEIPLVIKDGNLQVGELDYTWYVSREGDFRIDLSSGPSRMVGGVMAGQSKNVQVFSGNLAGDNPEGKYLQYITSISSGGGCTADITFSRYEE